MPDAFVFVDFVLFVRRQRAVVRFLRKHVHALSIARFELVEQGTETKIIFDHAGFPRGKAEHLAEGWKINYWEPLGKFLS